MCVKHNLICRAAMMLCALALMVAPGRAQTADGSAERSEPFAPLEQWKNAMLAGDASGLRTLYSTSPPAQVASAGKPSDLEADIEFWLRLKAREIKMEVAQTSSPQPGMRILVFQAEIHCQKPQSQPIYVNEMQAWQQQKDGWRLLAEQRTDATHLKQPLNKDKDIYSASADAHAEIREAEDKAAKEGKRVLLVFGANWCYDCHVLDLAFHRPDFLPVVSRYEVVHVDIGPDGHKNPDVAKQFQVPLEKGIPALAVLESSGQLVVSQKNGEFENARAMTPEALLEFLNKWKVEAR